MFRCLKSFSTLSVAACVLGAAGMLLAINEYSKVTPIKGADAKWQTAKQKGPSLDEAIRSLGQLPENVYDRE